MDRFATRPTAYSPTSFADAHRWMRLCKLLIGQHPGRVVIIKDSHVIEVHWSAAGLAFSLLHIAYVIGSMIVLICSNLHEFRRHAIIDLNVSYVQKFIVHGLNTVNVYALFAQLVWHRRCVHDQNSIMLRLEQQFSVIGINVELQRHRTYIRSLLWAIGCVAFNLFHLSYSFYLIITVDPPWMWLVVVVGIIMLPTIYRQSMVFFYLYDLAETKRHFTQLNDVLRDVVQAERLKASK